MGSLGSTELIIILVIILLVFGSTKLPKLARSLGQAQKEFKHGMTDAERDEQEEEARAIESREAKANATPEVQRGDAERSQAPKDSPTS